MIAPMLSTIATIVVVVVVALKSSSRNVGKKSCVPWLMKLNAPISSTR
jgi:hypothetical protein